MCSETLYSCPLVRESACRKRGGVVTFCVNSARQCEVFLSFAKNNAYWKSHESMLPVVWIFIPEYIEIKIWFFGWRYSMPTHKSCIWCGFRRHLKRSGSRHALLALPLFLSRIGLSSLCWKALVNVDFPPLSANNSKF